MPLQPDIPRPEDIEQNLKALVERGELSPEDYEMALADIAKTRAKMGSLKARSELVDICGIPTRFVYPVTYRAALLMQRLASLANGGKLSIGISDDAGLSMDHFEILEPLLACCYPDLARDPGIANLHIDAIAECITHLGSPEVQKEIAKSNIFKAK